MLSEFVTTTRDEILASAREYIKARKWPTVSDTELEHGLPTFLTQLAETLRLRDTSAPYGRDTIGTTAGKHGSEALSLGFSVAQVVHDYGDICQAITNVAVKKQVQISAEDFQTLNLCLDDAIAGAVTEFSRQREQTLGDGEVERLGYLTHELRNRLSTAMLSFAAIKVGRVGVGGSTAGIVDRSHMAMRDLLDTTISEVRLAGGTQDARRISVARFIAEVAGAAALQAAHAEMDLKVATVPPDVMVMADSQLLSSAVFNLLQNAFKYSVPHGTVALRTVCGDAQVSIEVEDECGGLPDENAEAFFSPFGARRGKDRSGLGLGLSVSRKAVRAFGGDIRVRNLRGKGCIFAIDLPVAT